MLHEAVAAKLEADPNLLDIARENLRRWLRDHPAPALREWQQVLERLPLSDVLALLRSPSDDAVRLRQSSPFAGILTPSERRSIFTRHEPRRA